MEINCDQIDSHSKKPASKNQYFSKLASTAKFLHKWYLTEMQAM